MFGFFKKKDDLKTIYDGLSQLTLSNYFTVRNGFNKVRADELEYLKLSIFIYFLQKKNAKLVSSFYEDSILNLTTLVPNREKDVHAFYLKNSIETYQYFIHEILVELSKNGDRYVEPLLLRQFADLVIENIGEDIDSKEIYNLDMLVFKPTLLNLIYAFEDTINKANL